MGGTTAAEGNLIAFNLGPGVSVIGADSVGNQIAGNQIYSDDDSAQALQFDGSSYVSIPNGLIVGSEGSTTLEGWFKTTSGGVIFGRQGGSLGSTFYGWDPTVYVGTDGRLYAGGYDPDSGSIEQVTSSSTVNDGQWHNVAFVTDGVSGTMTLYLDGQLVGSVSGSAETLNPQVGQIGMGFTEYWPDTPGGFYGFVGEINDVRIWSEARTADEIGGDMTTGLSAGLPGLEADYLFDDGQGLTARDLTSNGNNGTLSGFNGDVPTWAAPAGVAVDLGDDGITYNATAPRQGPNNFQNFPIVITNADGSLQGWLSGSLPDTTFLVDIYASAAFSLEGAGQAQDYLGSLEVTTDGQGQALFNVPFTAPEGMPVVTATATDPDGNTSEVSAVRRASLEAPAQDLRVNPGQPLAFSTALGDGIAIEDPDAGPLDPAWNLTLTVSEGTLSLSSLSGLTGSGDGTSVLEYSGSLSALDAALGDLSYVQASGSHGIFTMSVNAVSAGAPALQAEVTISDGLFTVTSDADSGPGSLRQAILDSDALSGGANTIDFAIPGQGIQTIAPLSALPAITNPVLIDGFSQPGFSAMPLIELSGAEAGTADGLNIACSGVTIRGLDINSFASGAGIGLSGTAATGNTIEADDFGTDPTGLQPFPNEVGIQISDGASNNLIGGATAAEGNLIAYNMGPGVQVVGNGSAGNQITANRIYYNDDQVSLSFDGSTDVALSNNPLEGAHPEITIEASFETTSGGVIIGFQNGSISGYSSLYVPSLYVGLDGKLYGDLLSSPETVNDGRWHQVALVVEDGESGAERLYLDGQLVASTSGSYVGYNTYSDQYGQIGTGYTAYYYYATNNGWYGFVGQIDDVRIWNVALSSDQIQQDRVTPPSATTPGLVADFPLDEGQGLTAYNLTPDQVNGTLSGSNGDLPTWIAPGGKAIDLGEDEIQNSPVVVTTAAGGLEGWLGGSKPNTTFRVDIFASNSFSREGAGQAQDYLGSLEVTTDSTGQAVFNVPFAAPAGLPVITATATDPQGDTSEVSAIRQPTLDVPTQIVPRGSGRVAVVLGGLGRWDLNRRLRCRTAGSDVGPDAFGVVGYAVAFELDRTDRLGKRHERTAICRIALCPQRGAWGPCLRSRGRVAWELHDEPERQFGRCSVPKGSGEHQRRRVHGNDDGRQRSRLAAAGNPRFQRRHGRNEHHRLRDTGPGDRNDCPTLEPAHNHDCGSDRRVLTARF